MTMRRIIPALTALSLAIGACIGGSTGVTSTAVSSLEVTQGDVQAGIVGYPLDTTIVLTAQDSSGNPMGGVSLTVVPSAGMVGSTVDTTNDQGQDSVTWTLGTKAGVQLLVVHVTGDTSVVDTLSATAYADLPDSMFLYSGDKQFELTGHALPLPIAVKVIDQYGNAVADAPLVFTVMGGGSLASAGDTVPTDLDGIASVTWTLASAVGAESVTAVLPDSSIGDVTNLAGSPVTFSAQAVAFAFDSVAPSPPVVGDSLTLYGMGFDPDSSGNVVTIGGTVATILTGTQTTLTVRVPDFGCTPDQNRAIQIERGPDSLSTIADVQPADALDLAVGGSATMSNPADYCLQFLSSSSGNDEYLVGLTATAAVNGDASFVMSGDDGVNPVPAPSAAPTLQAAVAAHATPLAREMALRTWESRFFRAHRSHLATRTRAAPGISPAPQAPTVGDTMTYRVPDITGDPCNDYTSTLATILAVGPHVVVATDAALSPTVQASISTALTAFMNTFGDTIYTAATSYFGSPTDLDANGGITLLLTSVVPSLGVETFTTAVDFTDRATCPASNQGEVIYVGVPAAPTLSDLQTLLTTAPPLVAHDLTNVIEFARRVATGGVPLAPWIAEGQAALGTEVAGLAMRGEQLEQDYGWSVVNADVTTQLWYAPTFDKLSMLFGWDGASGTVAGAPAHCSLFGFASVASPCDPQYADGAEWSFLQYVSDQLAGSFSGGVRAFQQALIGTDSTSDGTGVLSSLAGSDLSDLIVRWAMTLYTDGKISASAAPDLQIGSWNLNDIYDSLPAIQRLAPAAHTFASFSASGSVVGGGTGYGLISAGGAHGALAVKLRDAAGAVLGGELAPRVWVVRVK